ncbi:hypothetical protein [Caulobacter henricii]|nr:hypothetical protein [Caulobacter henricii]
MIVVLGWIAIKALFNELSHFVSAQLDHHSSVTALVGERLNDAVPLDLNHAAP